jgi:hypothetical protein
MPTIPDNNASRARPPDVTAILADLLHDHGEHWQIEHETTLNVWTAVRRSGDGRHIRCIVAHTPAELGAKLGTAETVEP